MSTYKTGNPLGSAAVKDLFDNAENLDFALNSLTALIWTDRLGKTRRSFFGMESAFATQLTSQESRFNTFIQNSGYEVIGDYTAGPLTLTEYNQLIRYNNELYKLTAATDIPFTTTGNTDETWISTDAAHFVSAGDGALRQDLGSNSPGLGASLSALEQGGKVQDAIFYITPGMFGYKADYNQSTDTGTDNTLALRIAIAVAITLGYQEVKLPAGRALFTDEINLGGVGYRGRNGVILSGSGIMNTILQFRPSQPDSVFISNRGGSGVSGGKALRDVTLVTTNATVGSGILYLLDSCCLSYNKNIYAINGLVNIKLLNSTAKGQFTEFNTFENCRVHNGVENILFEVNGGDNSFHGNSFINIQNQVLAGSSPGVGVSCNGVTGQVYLYNQFWSMHFFGGTGCRAIKLTRANTDNLWGNLTHEGALICESTDASRFEFRGNFSGIGTLSFIINSLPAVQSANFVFRNTMSDFSAFTASTISSFTPRLQVTDVADLMDNGFPSTTLRIRNSAGQDGLLFNIQDNSPGWYFTSTAVNSKIQSATPRYFLRSDGGAMSFGALTARLRPSDSMYGLQVSGDATKMVAPETDNVMSCGAGGYRWTQLYAVNSSIGTSDKRKKTNIRQISETEASAFYEIGSLDSVWQWIEKYEYEGDDARLHSGPTVQDAISIMDRYGLDWKKYSCFCYNHQDSSPEEIESWGGVYKTKPGHPAIYEEDGVTIRQEAEPEQKVLIRPAGSRVIKEATKEIDEYSFRKEELLFWISRAMIARQKNLEERILKLEQ
ncbi:TPA: hypothetical protein MAC63_005145 [Klebsiella pneumoniae]|nr:hypothetical protein [Klebsiella pneumoniae]